MYIFVLLDHAQVADRLLCVSIKAKKQIVNNLKQKQVIAMVTDVSMTPCHHFQSCHSLFLF